MILLANEHIEVQLDPDHGAEILSVRRPGGPNVLATYDWVSPVWASRSTSYGDAETDWLSEYRGGWQELFPNAGAACRVEGVPLPFHGEVSRARWAVHDQGADHVTLTTGTRLPMVLERRMWLAPDAPALRIESTVRLEGDAEQPFLWGHHPAFLATSGATIDMPSTVTLRTDEGYVVPHLDLALGATGRWPSIATRSGAGTADLSAISEGPVERLAYLSDFGAEPWAAIRGVAPGLGVAMAWDAATFPHAWFWWEVGGPGHPWHGRSRIVAIEPATAVPSDGLAAAIERGQAHRVGPGDTYRTWLTMRLFDADDRPVRAVSREGVVAR